MKNTDIFHVHTYRCKHAGTYQDEEYVKAAISLGANSIAFTDHAPFPGDPFGNRMKMCELQEYINSLKLLQQKYRNTIHISIGLEIEYFKHYDWYYQELSNNQNIQILVLGQHMYAIGNNQYSFSLSQTVLSQEEYIGLGNSIVSGIQTGLFHVVAHPDRIFRKHKIFANAENKLSALIIDTALQNNVALEINKSSVDTGLYVPEFWEIAKQKGANIIYGLDAHAPQELCLWNCQTNQMLPK